MCNPKGMVLIESLLLLMICLFLCAIVIQCVQATVQLQHADQKGYQDEEVRAIYQ